MLFGVPALMPNDKLPTFKEVMCYLEYEKLRIFEQQNKWPPVKDFVVKVSQDIIKLWHRAGLQQFNHEYVRVAVSRDYLKCRKLWKKENGNNPPSKTVAKQIKKFVDSGSRLYDLYGCASKENCNCLKCKNTNIDALVFLKDQADSRKLSITNAGNDDEEVNYGDNVDDGNDNNDDDNANDHNESSEDSAQQAIEDVSMESADESENETVEKEKVEFCESQHQSQKGEAVDQLLNLDDVKTSQELQSTLSRVLDVDLQDEFFEDNDQDLSHNLAEKNFVQAFQESSSPVESAPSSSGSVWNPPSYYVDAEMSSTRNTNRITALATEAILLRGSNRHVARYANATLTDFGIITEENRQWVIDHKKVERAKNRIRLSSAMLLDHTNPIVALFYDGKKDHDSLEIVVEDGCNRVIRKSVEHYTMVEEPGSRYLEFATVPEKMGDVAKVYLLI